MKFISSVADFKLLLTKAKTTISQKDANPVLRNFYVSVTGNDITVIATDLDLATVCKAKIDGKEDGSITIPGDKLYAIVDALTADTIEVETNGFDVFIKSGNFQSTLKGLDASDFPEVDAFEDENPSTLDKEVFLKNLNRISFSISDNEARRNLLAVYINDGYIQASDGHVSSVIAFDSNISDTLITSLAVPDLVRVLRSSKAEKIAISATKSFLLFKLDEDLFITRLSQANFPDIPNKVLKPTAKNPIEIEVDKKEFVQVVTRVAVTSNKSSLAVNFSAKENVMSIMSGDVEGNTSSEDITCATNQDIDFVLNNQYVLDFCKSIESPSIKMKIHPNMRIPIRIEDGDMTVLLMRLVVQSSSTDTN